MTSIPSGFRVAGIACGLKSNSTEDLTLIASDSPCVAAGVYTTNQVVAAPVIIDRERTPSTAIRAVIVNSGNANACTGEQGQQNAQRMLEWTAEQLGCDEQQVLVMSTGIIGEQLPMDKVEAGIPAAAAALGADDDHLAAAARGILTTDTTTKVASAQGSGYRVTGIAKGSGMIGPSLAGPSLAGPSNAGASSAGSAAAGPSGMATMLAVVMTDASLTPESAQQLLESATQQSFNAINVDGHTSTNDTVLLLASGTSAPLAGTELQQFAATLHETCIDLAKQIVMDGEGASHLVEILVSGAEDDAQATVIAKAIANSPLVKTAFAGNDPNWGRIVSAAGYAGPKIDVPQTTLSLNGTTLFQNGTPTSFDAEAVAANMKANRDIRVSLVVGGGRGTARFWTCDLTHEYVTINADYHT